MDRWKGKEARLVSLITALKVASPRVLDVRGCFGKHRFFFLQLIYYTFAIELHRVPEKYQY